MKLLTLEDLYSYYSSHKRNAHFNAKSEDKEIVVQIDGSMNFSKENDVEGLLPVHFQSCHTLDNVNGFFISEKSMKKAMGSFKNRPILAYIYQDKDGEYQFWSHNMHEDEDGNTVYDEVPVGIIPEKNNAELVYDEEKGKTYLEVDGYVFEDYSKAPDILRRELETKVSVELTIREMSYDAKEELLVLDDFYFTGITLLGRNPETGKKIQEGMRGSNCKITDFAKKKNSVFADEQNLSSVLEQLNNKLNELSNILNNKNTMEGGNAVSKFEELLEQYGKTVEDIDFEYETLTDEELEAKFAELFGETNDEAEAEIEATSSEEEKEETEPEEETEDSEDNTDSEEGDSEETEEEKPEEDKEVMSEETEEKAVVSGCSVNYSDGTVKTFGLTLTEQLDALFNLVNETYADADGTYYYVDADSEKKEVYMHDAWADKHYKQSYKVKNDVYSLTGDRVQVYTMYVTDDERKQLENMKSNYSSMSEELEKYHAEDLYKEKCELVSSDDYACIKSEIEFSELAKSVEEKADGLSFDELKEKADTMLLSFAKAGKITKAVDNTDEVKVNNNASKHFGTDTKKTSGKKGKYGKMFVKQ